MHRKTAILLLCTLFLWGCREAPEIMQIQEIAQLHPELVPPDPLIQPETLQPAEEISSQMRAVWIPYTLYGEWMGGKDETAFRETVQQAWDNCREMGLNTLFLHVRAFGDAIYPSERFARASYWDGSYDPLAVMIEEARARSLAVHAWINPLRCSPVAARESPALCDWCEEGVLLVQWGDMYYLNPAYPEVRQLIADGVTEILEGYDVDGIHIDDYFYPTTDPAFDAAAFSESEAEDLAQWRRDNCTQMVQALYAAVKAADKDLLFGISPQGNSRNNYEKLYADTDLWCRSEDCCDYIAPQLYYGFENAACPFAETLELWQDAAQTVDLVVGLAPYKIGKTDTWAGEGSGEWIQDGTVLSRQTELVLSQEGVYGVAYYSYASLFSPEETAAAAVSGEVERIRDILE